MRWGEPRATAALFNLPRTETQPWDPVALLRARAGDGCRINIIIEEPDARIEPLLDIDAIEVRASPAGAAHSL